jgi:hypothetical protein
VHDQEGATVGGASQQQLNAAWVAKVRAQREEAGSRAAEAKRELVEQ